ncbi:putative fatty acyl-CoA reductase CG8303 [Chironomus tepperi]|uniref:putative fatty acyl-CoA reductase CG8303 n=1 Tax=Chironomus tepperi TaxID=113505 RepID=UPI00391F4A8F
MEVINAVNVNTGSKKNIASFLSGKVIFVTGGTGFLGQCLIARLLSATPELKKIYVLVREKHGYSPESRIKYLMEKPLFRNLDEETKAKVLPLNGELCKPNFAIPENMLDDLLEEINIVYHVAATIKFNTLLGEAIKTNLIGTQVAVEFTKQLKNLVSFVYVSTAFCNSCYLNQGIKEQVYESRVDPYDMIKLVTENPDHAKTLPVTGTPELLKFINPHPNTYTFTKQLAENLIKRELTNYPAGIVRPSVVYSTYQNPVPGWCGNGKSGHIGFLAGYSKGLFRTMGGDASSIMDLIPCDYVANATVVLSWYVSTYQVKEVEVIHCTSGEINPLTFGEYCTMLNDASRKHPNDLILCLPKAKVRKGLRFKLFLYLFQILPALIFYYPEQLISKIITIRRKSLKYVQIFANGIEAFEYFTSRNFHYLMHNSLRILNCLEPEDAQEYNYNVQDCDWKKYMETQIIGIRCFYYKESETTTIWHRIMYQMYVFVQYLWYVVFFYVVQYIISFYVETPIAVAIATCLLLLMRWF